MRVAVPCHAVRAAVPCPAVRAAVPCPWDADDVADAVPILPAAAAGGRALPLRSEPEIPATLRKVEQPRFRSSRRRSPQP